MLFRWLKKRRRTKLLALSFPAGWDAILEKNVRHVGELSDAERFKLRDLVHIFVAEKNWEGCHGLQMTDEIKVTIAAQACLLLVGIGDLAFDHVLSILVYPTPYVAPGKMITTGGLVLEGDSNRLGEAWYRGPVILSWADALASGRGETVGHNLVIHEFAHQLDMLNDRVVDGTPPLDTNEQYERWQDVMGTEYEQLVETCRHGHRSLLDCYGATNVAEFFAVATECFFERPDRLQLRQPALYAVLRDFYQQDPAKRLCDVDANDHSASR